MVQETGYTSLFDTFPHDGHLNKVGIRSFGETTNITAISTAAAATTTTTTATTIPFTNTAGTPVSPPSLHDNTLVRSSSDTTNTTAAHRLPSPSYLGLHNHRTTADSSMKPTSLIESIPVDLTTSDHASRSFPLPTHERLGVISNQPLLPSVATFTNTSTPTPTTTTTTTTIATTATTTTTTTATSQPPSTLPSLKVPSGQQTSPYMSSLSTSPTSGLPCSGSCCRPNDQSMHGSWHSNGSQHPIPPTPYTAPSPLHPSSGILPPPSSLPDTSFSSTSHRQHHSHRQDQRPQPYPSRSMHSFDRKSRGLNDSSSPPSSSSSPNYPSITMHSYGSDTVSTPAKPTFDSAQAASTKNGMGFESFAAHAPSVGYRESMSSQSPGRHFGMSSPPIAMAQTTIPHGSANYVMPIAPAPIGGRPISNSAATLNTRPDTVCSSASRRAAQNRAAQRAFRQRKERYVKELEYKARILSKTQQRLRERREDVEKLRQLGRRLQQENNELRARYAKCQCDTTSMEIQPEMQLSESALLVSEPADVDDDLIHPPPPNLPFPELETTGGPCQRGMPRRANCEEMGESPED